MHFQNHKYLSKIINILSKITHIEIIKIKTFDGKLGRTLNLHSTSLSALFNSSDCRSQRVTQLESSHSRSLIPNIYWHLESKLD